MAERGGQVGNNNAAKNKPWAQAIERAIKKRSKSDQMEALDDLAEQLLVQCQLGEIAALKELGDRLDGKATTIIAGDDKRPLVVEIVRFADT